VASCQLKYSAHIFLWLDSLPRHTFDAAAAFLEGLKYSRGEPTQGVPTWDCDGGLRYVRIDVHGFSGSVFFYVVDDILLLRHSQHTGQHPSAEAVRLAQEAMRWCQDNDDNIEGLPGG
jgi:hypothetical protein